MDGFFYLGLSMMTVGLVGMALFFLFICYSWLTSNYKEENKNG